MIYSVIGFELQKHTKMFAWCQLMTASQEFKKIIHFEDIFLLSPVFSHSVVVRLYCYITIYFLLLIQLIIKKMNQKRKNDNEEENVTLKEEVFSEDVLASHELDKSEGGRWCDYSDCLICANGIF